jgi:hypothetical protein
MFRKSNFETGKLWQFEFEFVHGDVALAGTACETNAADGIDAGHNGIETRK